MPAAILVPALATVIGGGAAAGASIYGAKKAGSAADKSAAAQSAASREALEYTKEKDRVERADALAAERANYEQYMARERRLSPYRSAGQGASNTIASMLGLPTAEFAEPSMPEYLREGATPPAGGAAVSAGGSARRVTAGPNQAVPRPSSVDPNSSSYVGTIADLLASPIGRRLNPNTRISIGA